MSEYEKLTVEPRTIKGKEVKKLRREGIIPGVIYGPAVSEPEVIAVSARDFDAVYQLAGSSSLIDVSLGTMSRSVFIRHVERDPIKRTLIHTEFYAPNLDKATEMTVSIVTSGEPSEYSSGVLNHGRTDVHVRGLPASIPQQFEVDLTNLVNVDDMILVSDLIVPEGLEILTPGDEIIVRLSAAQRAAQSTEVEETETAEAQAGTDTEPGN